jgi:hypothetical protein
MIGLNADRGLDHIERAARIGKKFLGWTEERAEREVEGYREALYNRKNVSHANAQDAKRQETP